jgi:signal transduction histidine kinase
VRRLFPSTFHNQLLFYLSLIVALLAVFCIPLWRTWTGEIAQGRAEFIRADANRMAAVFATRGPAELAAVIDDRVGNEHETTWQFLLLLGPNNERLAGNLQQAPAGDHPPGVHFSIPMQVNGRRALVELVEVSLPRGYRLWVGRDVTRFENLESMFLNGLLGSGSIAFVVVAITAFAARRAALARLDTINRTTAAIVEGDLSQRLPVSGTGDEFDMLARTVNRMLEQIDDLVQNVKHSSNAIAHDLRTPLAELRSHLERLAIMRPDPEETFAAIDVAITDVDRVIAIFNAILRLAEIDSGTRRAAFKPVDVAEVIEEAVEFYAPVGEMKGITLTASCRGDLSVRGDALLLAQALGNMIDNALKYAGEGCTVVVSGVVEEEDHVDIVVADNGPGIAATDLAKAANRFFRADPSRGSPGVGLGLALVSAVAKLHGGTLVLSDNTPGLRATIRIAKGEHSGHRRQGSQHRKDRLPEEGRAASMKAG